MGILPVPTLPDGRVPFISNEYAPGRHDGVDFAYNRDTADPTDAGQVTGRYFNPLKGPVMAFADGLVVTVRRNTYRGKYNGWEVKLAHADGTFSGYLHLAENSVLVSVGEHVAEGQVIAAQDNDRSSARAFVHLHFFMKDENGGYLDPTPFVIGRASAISPSYDAAPDSGNDWLGSFFDDSDAAADGGGDDGGTDPLVYVGIVAMLALAS